ncbi:MAG: exo-alpha-sialidase [Candidatus Melainabacteria bacterium]|nr:exo-alpha-sialidase [Candidatus Melainabacteria bacterium]
MFALPHLQPMQSKLPFIRSHHTCLVLMVVVFTYVLQLQSVRSQPPPRPEHGPWNNDLYILESTNGFNFSNAHKLFERAGVATLVQDSQNRLIAAFQWFPFDDSDSFDRVAVSFSYDSGKSWSHPQTINIEGLPEGFMRPFDPTLVVLDDGRLRLYFSSHNYDNRIPATYSAVSADGIHYTFEPGIRFAAPGEMVIDCAVGRLGDTWHYYAPVQGTRGVGYHAISQDGLHFRRLANVELQGAENWLGCVLPTNNGLRFYGTGHGVWSAWSPDGTRWHKEHGSRTPGADPAVAATMNGKLIMIVTGPPRHHASPSPFHQARPPIDRLDEL